MMRFATSVAIAGIVVATWSNVSCLLPAAGQYFEATYPGENESGKLAIEARYTLWVPNDQVKLRGLIVHQHGCGFEANAAGMTAAYDLHWQALASKWDCGLIGPSYRQKDKGREPCFVWSDPRRGSRARFLQAVDDFARQSEHPELVDVPWCLWGHSGGAAWVSAVQVSDPERIVAAWLRSGTAYPLWEGHEWPPIEIPDATYRIPTMLNPGYEERTRDVPVAAWLGSHSMFRAYRQKNALIGMAIDPVSGHECGDSRYLAIPFFDTCLAMRLPTPESHSHRLRAVDQSQGCLAAIASNTAVPVNQFTGDRSNASWLPSKDFAKQWNHYVESAAVPDKTPPPRPFGLTATEQGNGTIVLRWDCIADFESGLKCFVIERDGIRIAKIPEHSIGRFGRPLFQTMSFHDTPEEPLPDMSYIDRDVTKAAARRYRIFATNSYDLESEPSESVTVNP